MPGNAKLSEEVMSAAECLWHYHNIRSEPQEADVIVALGSYDLRVASRAAALFHDGLSGKVVATGGYGNWTKGRFQRPEGEIFAEVLKASGVPGERLMVESRASNIRENIEFTRSLLSEGSVGSALFVTKPQTQRRVLATIGMVWPDIRALVCAPVLTFHEQPTANHDIRDLVNEMVGDLIRIKLYAERGWQLAQEIPSQTEEAARFLIDAGFTAHLPR